MINWQLCRDVPHWHTVTVPRPYLFAATFKSGHSPSPSLTVTRRQARAAAGRPHGGQLSSMRFESHFKSYFGNVKAFNLKNFKIIAEPVAAMAGGGLRLGGDGRRIP